MRFFASLVVLASLIVPALAQQQRVESMKPDDELTIAINQTRVFRFTIPFATVVIPSKGVVGFDVLSDQSLAITGVGPGSTAMLLQDSSGRTIYNAVVTVNPEYGRSVKIYGMSTITGGGRDYFGYYCTESTCSRQDRDVPDRGDQGMLTIRRPLPGGGFVETITPRR